MKQEDWAATSPAYRGKQSHLWLSLFLTILAVAWAVFRVGPRVLVGIASDAVRAVHFPVESIQANQAYTQSSPLDALAFQLLPWHTTNSWVLLHGISIVAAMCCLSAWLLVHGNIAVGRRLEVLRIFVLGTTLGVLLVFIGSYDGFTMLAFGFALWAWSARSIPFMLVTGSLVGLAHAEQGVFAFGAVAALQFWAPQLLPNIKDRYRSALWVILGILCGRAMLALFLQMNAVDGITSRSSWISDRNMLKTALVGTIGLLPLLILSLFAGLWVVVAKVISDESRKSRWTLGLLLVCLFCVSAITLDHTRVFVMTSLPLQLLLLAKYGESSRLKSLTGFALVAELAVWVIVPFQVLTSPERSTGLLETNIADQWLMMLSHITHGGWA